MFYQGMLYLFITRFARITWRRGEQCVLLWPPGGRGGIKLYSIIPTDLKWTEVPTSKSVFAGHSPSISVDLPCAARRLLSDYISNACQASFYLYELGLLVFLPNKDKLSGLLRSLFWFARPHLAPATFNTVVNLQGLEFYWATYPAVFSYKRVLVQWWCHVLFVMYFPFPEVRAARLSVLAPVWTMWEKSLLY